MMSEATIHIILMSSEVIGDILLFVGAAAVLILGICGVRR